MKTAIRNSEFSSEWNMLNNQFRDIIFKIKPTCRVKEPSAQTIDLSDVDTEVSTSTPSKRPRPSDTTIRPSPNKRQQRDIDTPSTPVKQESFSSVPFRAASVMSTVGTMGADTQNPFLSFRNIGRLAMDIRDIRNEVRKKRMYIQNFTSFTFNLLPSRDFLCLNRFISLSMQ